MIDFKASASRMPEGSIDLNEEMYLDAVERRQVMKPGGAYERAIRDRLRAKGMNDDQIERRMSLGRRPPAKGYDLI